MLVNQNVPHMLWQRSCKFFKHSVALLLKAYELQLSRLCELGFLGFGLLFVVLCLKVLILDANALLELELECIDHILVCVLQLETELGA